MHRIGREGLGIDVRGAAPAVERREMRLDALARRQETRPMPGDDDLVTASRGLRQQPDAPRLAAHLLVEARPGTAWS